MIGEILDHTTFIDGLTVGAVLIIALIGVVFGLRAWRAAKVEHRVIPTTPLEGREREKGTDSG